MTSGLLKMPAPRNCSMPEILKAEIDRNTSLKELFMLHLCPI